MHTGSPSAIKLLDLPAASNYKHLQKAQRTTDLEVHSYPAYKYRNEGSGQSKNETLPRKDVKHTREM